MITLTIMLCWWMVKAMAFLIIVLPFKLIGWLLMFPFKLLGCFNPWSLLKGMLVVGGIILLLCAV